jgi:hypothetical protein
MDEDKNYAPPLLIAQLNVAEGVSNRMANILKNFCNAMLKTCGFYNWLLVKHLLEQSVCSGICRHLFY